MSLTGFVDQSCFPGKGSGPGFSFSCRPLALDRTLLEWARRIFLYAFLHVFSEDEVTFVCIFTGFAESRLWECRVFSFKIARISQKSRVFPFTFVPAPRKSHDLHVFCVYLCDSLRRRCMRCLAVSLAG